MKAFFDKQGKIVHRETDAIDIWTKRYSIRIRISGVRIIRHARPKKGLPEETIYDQHLKLT